MLSKYWFLLCCQYCFLSWFKQLNSCFPSITFMFSINNFQAYNYLIFKCFGFKTWILVINMTINRFYYLKTDKISDISYWIAILAVVVDHYFWIIFRSQWAGISYSLRQSIYLWNVFDVRVPQYSFQKCSKASLPKNLRTSNWF
jgi:hypothetical protein